MNFNWNLSCHQFPPQSSRNQFHGNFCSITVSLDSHWKKDSLTRHSSKLRARWARNALCPVDDRAKTVDAENHAVSSGLALSSPAERFKRSLNGSAFKCFDDVPATRRREYSDAKFSEVLRKHSRFAFKACARHFSSTRGDVVARVRQAEVRYVGRVELRKSRRMMAIDR